MASYRVVDAGPPDAGIRITCEDHGESEQFKPGYRAVAFHCDECGIEVEVTLADTEDWRDLAEMC